jgi:hypothetical protein
MTGVNRHGKTGILAARTQSTTGDQRSAKLMNINARWGVGR